MPRIAVDLTPILPSGENGGAKIMTIELLRHLAELARDCEFILLTAAISHDELAFLEAPNMRRLCMDQKKEQVVANDCQINLPKKYSFKKWLVQKIPSPIKSRLRYIYQQLQRRKFTPPTRLEDFSIDLLFCPFPAPSFGIDAPIVYVIYDIQYSYYPEFFTKEDRYYREKYFNEACQKANRLICISDYVKETIYQKSPKPLKPEQVITIYIALSHRLPKPTPEATEILNRFGLKPGKFIFYPANFWAHKNHKMLLTAYSLYLQQKSSEAVKLVFTGFPCANMESLQAEVKKIGLEEAVLFLGYVTNEEFAALIEACHAVVFPSLYEGFGMPILEAMLTGKPVLCSNVTSLPEIAGDAALLFDPLKPEQIANAIIQITSNDQLVENLITRGKQRVQQFGDGAKMAAQYLQVFRDVISQQAKNSWS